MEEFDLNGHEYIELNKLLKFLHLAASGGEANVIIDSGEVMVNDAVETQKRKKLRTGDTIKFKDASIIIR
jgi:ribosome-associated protein